jgi:hypothetical protein
MPKYLTGNPESWFSICPAVDQGRILLDRQAPAKVILAGLFHL